MSTSSYSASLRFRAASSTHFATSSDFRFGRVLPVMIPTLSMESPSVTVGGLTEPGVSASVFPQRVASLAISAEFLADATNLRLALAQRLGRGVHGVVAEDEVVRMLGRRAEHEPRVALGEEVDRFLGGFEDRDLPAGNARGAPERPILHGDPGHRVSLGRVIGPTLAGLQAHHEVGHGRRTRWGSSLCRRRPESPAPDPRLGPLQASRSDSRWPRSLAREAARPTAGSPSRAPARERRYARHRFPLASTRRFRPTARLPCRSSPSSGSILRAPRSPWRCPSAGASRAPSPWVQPARRSRSDRGTRRV